MELKKETSQYFNLGCDPEFFFKRKQGNIVGAETVLPKNGLRTDYGNIIIDGVQAELNPVANTCRDLVANNIRTCFLSLNNALRGSDITCDFNRTIEISAIDLKALAESSQTFGCAPSQSIYKDKIDIKAVNASEYRIRAAGGHIHLGHCDNPPLKKALVKDCKRTVAMLDIIVGNTSVLVDRDAGNVERRKLYGRAGEYRLPAHGLEYRTLSNYWLMCKPLMSFAFGMARFAGSLMADKDCDVYFDAFASKVKKSKIHKAINNNDFELAQENFNNIETLITTLAADGGGRTPINSANIKEFKHFVKIVNSKGLEHYFPHEPMKHWIDGNITGNYWKGFNDFLINNVRQEMEA